MDVLRIGESGLIAHKARMAVTSNNVANINTPGYHRQTAVLQAQPPVDLSGNSTYKMSFGTGVKLVDIIRQYDQLKEATLKSELATTGNHAQLASALKDLESIMTGSNDANLSVRLQEFWTSWQDVANNSDSLAFRTILLQRSQALTNQFRDINNNLTDYKSGISSGTGDTASGALARELDDINACATEIASLNKTIFLMAARGNDCNTLMDRRDTLVNNLSAKINVDIVQELNKTFTITVDGQNLVTGFDANAITIAENDPIQLQLDGINISPTDGAVAGFIAASNEIDNLLAGLNTLAANVIAEVNSIHTNGFDLYGRHATDDYDPDNTFFNGTDATDMVVNNTLIFDPALIAAAATRYSAGPPPLPNVGDGAQALAVADLCAVKIAALDNRSFGQYYSDMLISLGGKLVNEQNLAENGKAVIAMLQNAIQQDSGVNLDAEMVEMLSAQRAFQAASKIIATADSMLDTLINRM